MSLIEKIALKPCPFCGSGPAKGFGRYTQASFSGVEVMDELDAPYVWCGTCCARTCTHDSKAEAIAAWNNRAALTAIMGEGDGVQQCDREAAAAQFTLLGPDGDRLRDHFSSAFARHRSTAAAAERARIVAWLRGASDGYDNPSLLAIADAIEQCEV